MGFSPAWGMDDQERKAGLKLQIKTAEHQFDKSKKKSVAQFTSLNGDPYPHEQVFYDISSLQNLLNYLGEECRTQIAEILKTAVLDPGLREQIESEYPDNVGVIASIKNFLTHKDVINANTVRRILENYVDPYNEDVPINVTGSALTTDLIDGLAYYMQHCQAVYTDFTTRDFLNRENIHSLKDKWNTVINNRIVIKNVVVEFEEIKSQYSSIKKIPPILNDGNIFGAKQLPSIEPEEKRMQLDEVYKDFIETTLNGLDVIKISLMDEIIELTQQKNIIVDINYLNNTKNRTVVHFCPQED